ncbi:DUF3006 domain-containing protein [Murimonas intestini]|uniref:DUF3006 domain-containing protein n=1 Tax=Murimonas intestini TaxID=1337051 RepID=A0AB73T477_9FIRM|nr:DUF3006 domain-containing protein [Murimonas intestini]MCR1840527.1 DUF3006 domain-containing protein [Murimonas intestini]MCR1865419.1 DUF3006 domain-containing protein [Murimonas intestini]MCR1882870.1 DUF3006 domain-containing protein [Murimonas intestini]
MKGTIDRIEGQIVVCEMEQRRMIEIPLEAFDTRPVEGDVITWEAGRASVLEEETASRKEKVQSLFDRLKKKS